MPITFSSQSLASVLDSSTTAWIAQVVTNGGTVSDARAAVVDEFIRGLKADGLWTKQERLWLLAAENSQSALTDIVGLTLAIANGSPTFTTDQGYTGVDASTTVYLDTGWNPPGATLFAQDSAHISIYSNTNTTSSASGGCPYGLTFQPAQIGIFIRYSDGTLRPRINDTTLSTNATNADSRGFYIVNRDTSTTEQVYKNGVNYASNGTTSAPDTSTDNIFILAGNSSNSGPVSPAFGSAIQVSMAGLGSSLSAADAVNFYKRVRSYVTAIGIP